MMVKIALIVCEQVKLKAEKMEMLPTKKKGLGFLKKLLFERKRVSSRKCLALNLHNIKVFVKAFNLFVYVYVMGEYILSVVMFVSQRCDECSFDFIS